MTKAPSFHVAYRIVRHGTLSTTLSVSAFGVGIGVELRPRAYGFRRALDQSVTSGISRREAADGSFVLRRAHRGRLAGADSPEEVARFQLNILPSSAPAIRLLLRRSCKCGARLFELEARHFELEMCRSSPAKRFEERCLTALRPSRPFAARGDRHFKHEARQFVVEERRFELEV